MKNLRQLRKEAAKIGLKIAATTRGKYVIQCQEQHYPFKLLRVIGDLTLGEVNEYFGTK